MQEESLNSWNEDLSPITYDSEELVPADLIRVIDMLKTIKVSQIKAKFHFKTELFQRKFSEMLKKEELTENDHSPSKFTSDFKKKKKYLPLKTQIEEKKFKHQFSTGSPIISEVFLRAYEKTIRKLQVQQDVIIYKGGKDIFIASQNKAISSILNDEIMALYKRLKVYIQYRRPDVWKIVESSEILQKELVSRGIFCYFHSLKSRMITFYSTQLSEEEIKKIVNEKLAYAPKILNFYDKDLKHESNTAIFGLLSKCIANKVKQIRQIYESIFEVNLRVCSFVLHMKNEVFSKQPIAELKQFISNLIFVSFSLRNSRNYLNQIKRMAKKHQYLEITQQNHRIYLCINKKKIKHKDDIMFIFKRYLETLEDNSKLTIHLKPNHTMNEQSTFAERILYLIEQNKLTCKNYEQIYQKKTHNICVEIKNAFSIKGNNKAQKQAQLANFLRNMLELEATTERFTEEEMNDTFMIDHPESTDTNSQNIMNKEGKQTPGYQADILDQVLTDNVYMKQDKFLGTFINFEGKEVTYGQIETFKKQKRDLELQEALYEQQTIKFRCWRLQLNKDKFSLKKQIDKTHLYMIDRIVEETGDKVKNPKIITFTMLEINSQGFLAHYDSDKEQYCPHYLIKRVN